MSCHQYVILKGKGIYLFNLLTITKTVVFIVAKILQVRQSANFMILRNYIYKPMWTPMDMPSKITELDPAKLAFALLIISLFLPWFTVSITTSYESDEGASLQKKEVLKMGPNEISYVTEEESMDRNGEERNDFTVFNLPIEKELLIIQDPYI